MKDCITLHDKSFVPYIEGKDIEKAIRRLADEVNSTHRGEKSPVILLCVLNGAIMFTGELMKHLDFPLELMTIRVASYSGTSSGGHIREITGITGSVKGRKVIICEDIVDTGTTMTYLVGRLKDAGAAEIEICTMLLKPTVYKQDLKLDYVGLEIPDRFIVGYGLDYDQLGRNLNDIYVLKDK